MLNWSKKKIIQEHETVVLGLQYTIAQRDRVKALWGMVSQLLESSNAKAVAKVMECLLVTKAERYQDVFALLHTGYKENGFFVEFGACDGLFQSNTFMLETMFGWQGILAEPGKNWHEELARNRIAKIDKRCVSSKTGDTLDFFQSNVPGNSSTEKDHPYLGMVDEFYTVETVSLLDLLRDNNAPRHIDFLSVDTEGHEREVFSTFDFDQYSFGFICVEQHAGINPAEDAAGFLEAAGYRNIFPREPGLPLPMQISGVDMFFLPPK